MPQSICLIDNFFGHDATLCWVVGEGFGIQIQSTVFRLLIAWINLLYLQFQCKPLWPSKEMILADSYTTCTEL